MSGKSSKTELTRTAEQVFSFWRWITEKPRAKFLGPRKARTLDRLKDGYSEDYIRRAIVGCTQSKFHTGENERGKEYVDLELICRNPTKLEGFADSCQQGAYDQAIREYARENPSRSPEPKPVPTRLPEL